MEQGISEVVGRADLDNGGSTQLYRALRLLLCATCGAEISEGTLFTRRKVKGIGLRIMPQCRKCAPFTQQPEKRERSALLDSLLTVPSADSPRPKAPPAKASSHDGALPREEDEKGLDEKVRRRLGPALKRGRRSREGG